MKEKETLGLMKKFSFQKNFGISIGLGVFSFSGCDRHLAIYEPIPYIFI